MFMSDQVYDKLEKLSCGSLIQHGPYNDRIYFIKPGVDMSGSLPIELIDKAKNQGYSKIFVKVPGEYSQRFLDAGYLKEACIPGFYGGLDSGVFMGYYLTQERSSEADASGLDGVLEIAKSKAGSVIRPFDSGRFVIRECDESDVEEMAVIYRAVFASYPFPIHEPEYLLETMRSHVDYFGVEHEGELVALSSAEMDIASSNVEMTDFATLPDWRGNGFGVHLLACMEKKMQQKGVKTGYTIARAVSAGMNITFAKLGYEFGGRLKNNTNISGDIESMNVWYKSLC